MEKYLVTPTADEGGGRPPWSPPGRPSPARRRTAVDFAEVLRRVVEDLHPGAARVVLVTDDPNARGPGGLHEAFDPAPARRVVETLGWHSTPKHGSWPAAAEVGLAALSAQRPDRRVGSAARPKQVVAAWEEERNERQAGVDRRSTTADARTKLRRLYPAAEKRSPASAGSSRRVCQRGSGLHPE